MSLFSSKSELALVFDIGSSAVAAGLVRLSHGEHAKVLHSVRESISYQEKVDPDRLFKDMVDALRRTHENIVKEGASHLSGTEFRHVDIKRVLYSFASPWSATQTKTLAVRKNQPVTFTRDLLNTLMLEDEGVNSGEALTVIERRVIQTKLNGYDIKDPFGKKAKEIDVSYFTGIVPKAVLDQVLQISHTAHLSKNIKSYTFPLIAYSTVHDAYPNEVEFVCVRIGGEISDISIVEDGLITESGSYPRGYNHVIRTISEKLNMGREEATSFLKVYGEGHAESNIAAKAEPIISSVLTEWVEGLRQALVELENGIFLPQKLFLMMDGDLGALFAKALSTGEKETFTVTAIEAPIPLIAGFAQSIYDSEKK